MLVFIVGPKGCGKTSVILELCRIGYGHPIPVFTTRAQRPKELEKISISQETFDLLQSKELFYTVNHVLGNKYGSWKETIRMCVDEPSKIGFLDLSVNEIEIFKALPSYKILLIPDSIQQLREQLINSNRHDRLIGIEEDYRKHIKFIDVVKQDRSWSIVINSHNQLEQTASKIQNILRELHPSNT